MSRVQSGMIKTHKQNELSVWGDTENSIQWGEIWLTLYSGWSAMELFPLESLDRLLLNILWKNWPNPLAGPGRAVWDRFRVWPLAWFPPRAPWELDGAPRLERRADAFKSGRILDSWSNRALPCDTYSCLEAETLCTHHKYSKTPVRGVPDRNAFWGTGLA